MFLLCIYIYGRWSNKVKALFPYNSRGKSAYSYIWCYAHLLHLINIVCCSLRVNKRLVAITK